MSETTKQHQNRSLLVTVDLFQNPIYTVDDVLHNRWAHIVHNNNNNTHTQIPIIINYTIDLDRKFLTRL